MKAIKNIWKWFSILWQPRINPEEKINTHKWESKIEIYRHISYKAN